MFIVNLMSYLLSKTRMTALGEELKDNDLQRE